MSVCNLELLASSKKYRRYARKIWSNMCAVLYLMYLQKLPYHLKRISPSRGFRVEAMASLLIGTQLNAKFIALYVCFRWWTLEGGKMQGWECDCVCVRMYTTIIVNLCCNRFRLNLSNTWQKICTVMGLNMTLVEANIRTWDTSMCIF